MTVDRLARSFYARPTLEVARDLLGRRMVRVLDASPSVRAAASPGDTAFLAPERNTQRLSGRIVEVEAYSGFDDAASHANRGRTARNAPMFGRPGHAYVYFIYGMHWMFNIIARHETPGAVLVRTLVPEEGVHVMREFRAARPDSLLTNGPARLAQAMAIDGALNGVDLCAPSGIFIQEGSPVSDDLVESGPRVRVSGDELALTRPWRFWIRDEI